MAIQLPRGAGYICRLCKSQQILKPGSRQFAVLVRQSDKQPQSHATQRRAASRQSQSRPSLQKSKTQPAQILVPKSSEPATIATAEPQHSNKSSVPIDSKDAPGTSRGIRARVNAIAASGRIPDQPEVLEILDQSYQLANLLIFGQPVAPEEQEPLEEENDGNSLLADLEEPLDVSAKTKTASAEPFNLPISHREKLAAEVCETVYNLVKIPTIVLDENILAIYVRIICQLGRPEYLPEVFFLYAHKPMPEPNTTPIRYSNPSANSAKSAVPQELSDVALDTAILRRDLPLAIAIIDSTVATRAFRTNKFLRKASVPLAFAGATPLIVYAAADWVANWQNTLDPNMAKAMTMMGAMAYVGTLGTIGFVALTTYNDHHDRVVWTPGTPLRERWMREEERLYFDRLAVAWGFQRRGRRGEEMGEEWEALRQELALRSMVLDKSDLLEGMQ